MRPRPTFNPHPQSSIPYHEARRSFDAELMAWAAETMVETVDRFEQLVNAAIAFAVNREQKLSPCESGQHQWNWMGGGPTFCRRCGLETHS